MTRDGTRRVVITGLGAVSSLGIGVESFSAAVKAGKTGTGPITAFDTTGFPRTMAGEVTDFDPNRLLSRVDPLRWGRSSLLAAAAAVLAVEDAAIDPKSLSNSAAGSVVGTTSGESQVIDRLTAEWVSSGLKSLDPALVAQVPANQIAAAVNTELALTGDALTLPTACAASNYALGYAADLVRTGEADFMICGGADSVNRYNHAGFYRLGALADEQVCRPFDVNRSGILTAEGGVALLIEPLEHAVARGARIYAEVLGYGLSCDAKHMVHPDAASIARCIRLAHRNSGVEPHEVDYICAHGTGTPTNDVTEVSAVRAVFGDRTPPISSIKSMLGHTMGAASGFGALICCRALYEGFLPPTANLQQVDPALGEGLDCVPGQARSADVRIAQNHGFAFGGNNAVIVLGRVE